MNHLRRGFLKFTTGLSGALAISGHLIYLLPLVGAGAIFGDPAIQEVLSGQRAIAEAHWWGFDPAEATQALQSAIRSGAKTVRVRKMSGPWIVDKIDLASDQELIFEPGVVVLAKAGAFQGQGDSLFTAASRKNIRLTGPGATLQMRRADYDAPPYRKAEWRHVLNLHSCTNITVTGLTLAESGGDGIYLGVDRSGGPNRDIVIRHVVCDRNYRQGISVISAENLLIEDCVLKNTAGTAPEAGIDFEPNGPAERLVNCVMRRCISENNRGHGYDLALRAFSPSSAPVSIRLEDCVSRGTNRQSAYVNLSMSSPAGVPGRIEFVNCRFEDQGRAGITITKPAAGAVLRFENCRLADPVPPAAAPIRLQAPAGSKSKLGGIQFVNSQFEESMDRPLLDFPSRGGVPLAEVAGELIRHFEGRTERTVLDAAWLAKVSPPDPLFEMPTLPLNLAALPQPASWTAPRQLPPHRLRGTATLGLSVGKNERVRLGLRFLPVGRAKEAKPLTAVVLDTSGKPISQFSVKLGEEALGEFTSQDAGVYRVRCDANKHTLSVTSSSHPVCLLGDEGTFHFISTAATFSFIVPPETREFGLRLTGEGNAECVKASIFDPSGRNVWSEEAIAQPRGFIGKPSANAPAGQWQLRLEKPTRGAFEDHYVELRGIPPVLFFGAPAPSSR